MCMCWFAPAGWGGHQAPSIGLRHTRRKGAESEAEATINHCVLATVNDWVRQRVLINRKQTRDLPGPHTQSLLSGTAPPPKSMDVVNQCLELAACRLSLAGAAASIVSFVPTKVCLSQQLLSQQIFVATNIILSRQAYFVGTKDVFYRDKHVFVPTKVCLFCRDKTFVTTKLCLQRQKFWTAFVCMFVRCGKCEHVCGWRSMRVNVRVWCGECMCVCVRVCVCVCVRICVLK